MVATPEGKSASRIDAKQARCKTILSESGICDYALNCYTGCTHACAYCYAQFMGRFHHPGEPWGSFVDAKVNAPEVLARQLRSRSLFPASVFVSSVCDPYQPAEAELQLTRRCLSMLLDAGMDVHLQTKSDLVRRDLDLLTGRENVSLCETVTTTDDGLAGRIEPGASPPSARVETLRLARDAAVRAKAFVGPLLPGLSDTPQSIEGVFSALAPLGLEGVYVDRLNLRWGVWPSLRRLLGEIAPGAVAPTRSMLYDEARGQAYNAALRDTVRSAARRTGLRAPLTLAF